MCKIQGGIVLLKFSFTIHDPQGRHARPAGMLVKEAAKFQSKCSVAGNGKTGDLKRIFSLMGMGIKAGMELTVSVEGPDEKDAAAALEAFLKANL